MEYRIVEKRFVGYSRYVAQYKNGFFWHTYKERGYDGGYDIYFSSIEDAKQFIERDKQYERNNKYVGEFIHSV